jgi:hypothetical protein
MKPLKHKTFSKMRNISKLSGQALMLMFVTACFTIMLAMTWVNEKPAEASSPTLVAPATPTGTLQLTSKSQATPTLPAFNQRMRPTPDPRYYTDNSAESDGIILGGVILVMIVVGGTVSVITRKD